MNKFFVSSLVTIMLPSLVFASDEKSYNAIGKIAQAVLNAFSWFGYALALRNGNIYGN